MYPPGSGVKFSKLRPATTQFLQSPAKSPLPPIPGWPRRAGGTPLAVTQPGKRPAHLGQLQDLRRRQEGHEEDRDLPHRAAPVCSVFSGGTVRTVMTVSLFGPQRAGRVGQLVWCPPQPATPSGAAIHPPPPPPTGVGGNDGGTMDINKKGPTSAPGENIHEKKKAKGCPVPSGRPPVSGGTG